MTINHLPFTINHYFMDSILSFAKTEFQKVLDHLKDEFAKLQTGHAQSSLIEGILVESYGAHMPLKNLAQITISDAKTIFINSYDKGVLKNIEKAICDANLGLNPVNDGSRIVISIPSLTEERRNQLTKMAGKVSEEARVHIRQVRQDTLNKLKNLEKEKSITEDNLKYGEKQLQDKVDEANKKIEETTEQKKKDIMKV